MMENKREGLVAAVVRLLGGLFGALGGSKKAPARSTSGVALAGSDGPVDTNDEPVCPDPANCPPHVAPVPAAS